jgi:DNA-3-methyladenine glycosylase I
MKKKRCFGDGKGEEFYAEYHDSEWGIPQYDDRHLFEMVVLEGTQAGLSWKTILSRREAYRKSFNSFDPKKVAKMTDFELNVLLINPLLIRNRLKIFSARKNASVFIEIQREFGSFARYLWGFVNGKPVINHWEDHKEVPTKTLESEALSKDLKRRGMSFVGPVIMYAYMQAVGLVNDHLKSCWRYSKKDKVEEIGKVNVGGGVAELCEKL